MGDWSGRPWPQPAGTVTVGPLLGRGRRALEPLSGSGIRPTVIDDTTSKPQPATWGQTGISVGHEDLSVIGLCVVTTPIPEVLTYFRSPRRSQPVEELHLERVQAAIDDSREFSRAGVHYHVKLVELSGNHTLTAVIGMLSEIIERELAKSLAEIGADSDEVRRAIAVPCEATRRSPN